MNIARLPVISLDSIFVNLSKEYYTQKFLEFKYEIKDKKILNTVNENLRVK